MNFKKFVVMLKKEQEWVKYKEYPTLEQAHCCRMVKNKRYNTKIVPIPMIEVGLKIYVSENSKNIPHINGHYGTVEKIYEYYFYIHRVAKGNDHNTFFLIETFEEKYISGIFFTERQEVEDV